eukprot:TRINITY_DN6063_c0_g1_i1.p1 TRINITY_DN6063_c0_g1~~TRINITY_DN6063_c0_g1_i1.p1  ORF type:complete len:247 (+),score=62.78 TRINITY_DN6063_c0_g1_i1:23-742(+)
MAYAGAAVEKALDPYGEVSTGTSVIALKYNGGVVLAADGRTSMGSYVSNRVNNKLNPVAENIYICRSGNAADTEMLQDYVTHYLNQHSLEKGSAPLVKTAARLFQQLCYGNRRSLSAGVIVAGWDHVDGPSVYSVLIGGAMVPQNYAVGGSGSFFIMGWLDQHWKSGMSEEEAVRFAQLAIGHAMARDGSSGGIIRHVVLTAEGSKQSVLKWPQAPYALENDPEFSQLFNPTAPVATKA